MISLLISIILTSIVQGTRGQKLYLYFLGFDLGSFQHSNQVKVVNWAALRGAEPLQDFVLNLLQLLLHLGIADDQLVLGLLKVRTLLSHHNSQHLVLQTTV